MLEFFIKVIVESGVVECYKESFENQDKAEAWAQEAAFELGQEYGYDRDPDNLNSADEMGKDWCEESQEYLDVVHPEYIVEVYDEEEHADEF
ncbi:hypothetical protein [Vibrio phage RYC]|nr:hypothetical protein [Vibrio phage RYC]